MNLKGIIRTGLIIGGVLVATSTYAQKPYLFEGGIEDWGIKKENIKEPEYDDSMIKYHYTRDVDFEYDGVVDRFEEYTFYDRNGDGNSDLMKIIVTHKKLGLSRPSKDYKLKHPGAKEILYWIDDNYDSRPDRIIHDMSPVENIDAEGGSIIGADGIFDFERAIINKGIPYFLYWDNKYSEN